MPNYTFLCDACETTWDQQLTIEDRKQPCNEPCPHCGAPEPVVEFVICAPGFGDSYRMGIKKIPAWFGERLSKIKEKYPGNNISLDRISKTI